MSDTKCPTCGMPVGTGQHICYYPVSGHRAADYPDSDPVNYADNNHLKRIADTLERIADALEENAAPPYDGGMRR